MTAHFFTIDVEEYFQVSAFESRVPRASWGDFTSRVTPSTDVLLDILEKHEAFATFFVLGLVAERHPDLIRRIADRGHEVASHGWDHRRVTHQTPEEFRASVRRAKCVLENLTGQPVLGFRAPSFSIVPGQEWALEVLIEEGYQYDSSLFPVARSGYGYPSVPRDPHVVQCPAGSIAEFPPATLRRWGRNIPAAGGGYFRIFPLYVVQAALRDSAQRGVPGTFYIHPWEVDPEQPRLSVPVLTRLRHYTGLRRTVPRLNELMSEFAFTSVSRGLPAAHSIPSVTLGTPTA